MKTKFKKFMGIVACFAIMLPTGLALTACGHTHDFSDAYVFNNTYHWQLCEAEAYCDKTHNYAKHNLSNWETKTASTCTEDEVLHRTCECGYEETKTGDLHHHNKTTQLMFNSTHHWFKCADCDEHLEEAEHNDDNQICTVCHEGAMVRIGETYFTSMFDAVASVADRTNADATPTTITLLADTLGRAVKVPSNKNIVFDLNGHTYTITKPAVGSTGTTTSGFQLLKNSNVTFKNGILQHNTKYTEVADDLDVQILIQNYANLTLENVTLNARSVGEDADGTCLYALSNNFGNVTIKGSTNIYADVERDPSKGTGGVAFDLWYTSGTYGTGVNVTFDETFCGIVDGKIEYGANKDHEDWENKACLTIKGSGTFTAENFIFYNTDSTTANIDIHGGIFRFNVASYVNSNSEYLQGPNNTFIITPED